MIVPILIEITLLRVDQVSPHVTLLEGRSMPNYYQKVFGPGNGYIKTALISCMAQTRFHSCMIITPDRIEDNDIFLSTLKSINRVNLYAGTGMDLSQPFANLIPEEEHLRFVRCHHTNFVGKRA